MFSLLGTSKVVSGRTFNPMTVQHVVEWCTSRKHLCDPKVEKRVSGKPLYPVYSFLSSISQIMNDVKVALQPASEEVASATFTPVKKAEQENNRANNLAQTLDDDVGRTATAQLDKPHASTTKSDDNKAAEIHWIQSLYDNKRVGVRETEAAEGNCKV